MTEAALESGVMAVDTLVPVVRQQQGDQSVSGWVLSCSISGWF